MNLCNKKIKQVIFSIQEKEKPHDCNNKSNHFQYIIEREWKLIIRERERGAGGEEKNYIIYAMQSNQKINPKKWTGLDWIDQFHCIRFKSSWTWKNSENLQK